MPGWLDGPQQNVYNSYGDTSPWTAQSSLAASSLSLTMYDAVPNASRTPLHQLVHVMCGLQVFPVLREQVEGYIAKWTLEAFNVSTDPPVSLHTS